MKKNQNNFTAQLKALEQEVQAFEAQQISKNFNQQQKTKDLLQFASKKIGSFLANVDQENDLSALEQQLKTSLNIDLAQTDEQNIAMAFQEIRKIIN